MKCCKYCGKELEGRQKVKCSSGECCNKYYEEKKEKATIKRKEKGFNFLNKDFPDAVRHHVNRNDVLYIPHALHSHIPHRLNNPDSMAVINYFSAMWLLYGDVNKIPNRFSFNWQGYFKGMGL